MQGIWIKTSRRLILTANVEIRLIKRKPKSESKLVGFQTDISKYALYANDDFYLCEFGTPEEAEEELRSITEVIDLGWKIYIMEGERYERQA